MKSMLFASLAAVSVVLAFACEAALPVAPAPLEKGALVRAKTEMIVSQTQFKGKTYEQVSFNRLSAESDV